MLLFEKLKEQNCSVFCLEITTVLTSIHKAFNKGSLTEKNGAVFPTRCQNSEAEKVDAANGEWAMASIADRYEEMKRSIGCVVSPT